MSNDADRAMKMKTENQPLAFTTWLSPKAWAGQVQWSGGDKGLIAVGGEVS